ncbi:MAG TPA: K+/H+ antiporter subunit F [Spongiibacteraceae bacterium]|nr:K+/H+ antiporter subunit F [Spongiibacteraceae bacterium]
MLSRVLPLAMAMLSVALLLCCYRLWRGPKLWDRVLALDTLYITSIGLLVLQDMRIGKQIYFEIALLVAAFGFLGTIALAKYLRSGNVID